MKLVRVVMATGLLLALSPPLPASAETEQVRMPGRFFSPARVSIRVGDTVRWTNTDNERHSVTATTEARSRGEEFDSSPSNCPPGLLFNDCMRRGQSFSHTFTTPGSFSYFCKVHGSDAPYPNCGMCGRVSVTRGSTGTIAPTTPGTARPSTPGSVSPSPSPSVSPSPSPSGTGTGIALPPGDDGDGGSPSPVAIAALAVVLLTGSGFLVYRTMIRR